MNRLRIKSFRRFGRSPASGARRAVLPVLAWLAWAAIGEATEPRNIRIERISTDEGLSQALVTCTLQDSAGFMWFGTQEGLNRYDGYRFTVFAHDPNDPNSLLSGSIKSIVEEHGGILWVATLGGGLSRFDTVEGTFAHFVHSDLDPASLSSNQVQVLYRDRDARLWVGTDDSGLDRFEPRTGKFEHIELVPGQPVSVRAIHQGATGALWLGTHGSGLFRFDPRSGAIDHWQHDPGRPGSLSDDRIMDLLEDRGGTLWVATYGGGLSRLDPATGSFDHFRHSPDDLSSLASDTTRALFEDRLGTLWVGTDAGLNEWYPESESFARYTHDPNQPFTLSHDSVVSIAEDRGGVLWIGTYGGLNKWNRATEAFRHYRHSAADSSRLGNSFVTSFAPAPGGGTYIGTFGGGISVLDPESDTFSHMRHVAGDPHTLSDDRVMALHTDSEGVLWIGSHGGGLDRFDPRTGRVTRIAAEPENPHGLSATGVTSMLEDTAGRFWIGTYRGGLNRLDRATGRFERFMHEPDDPTSLSSNRVVSLFEDRKGHIWVGTYGGGLNLFQPDSGTFTAFRSEDEKPRSLLSDDVWQMVEDDRGDLWLGTRSGGLSRWAAEDREAGRDEFRSYTEHSGLRSNIVYGLLIDGAGALWLSSNRGLTRFDPRAETFTHYDESHGLQGAEYNFAAAYRSPDGELFFGGINGFNVFRPEELQRGDYHAPIVLTRARIGNEILHDVTGSGTDAFRIEYQDRFFEFEFAALDYAAPSRIVYRYRLEGLDDRWIELGTHRRIGYAGLSPGHYTLSIGASNYDGSWNDNLLEVRLDVQPPPWATPVAKSVYILVAGLLLIAGMRGYRARLDRVRELAAATKAKELAEYASRSKSHFLANISHEIRTPLNGVLGMVEMLRQTELTKRQQRYAATAGRSARHLLNLLNDLLDLSKIEAGRLTLESVEFDLRQLIEEVVELFSESAQHQDLHLHHQVPEDVPRAVAGDPTRLRQVLANLVGNAVKFTDRGHVFVGVEVYSKPGSGEIDALFTVEDTGIGMDRQTQERIFESFRQADGSTTRKYGGTGLGLSISKQLVEMMGGEIWVESQPGRGSSFRFSATLERRAPDTSAEEIPAFSGKRALIAHGSELGAQILAEQLRAWSIASDVTCRLEGSPPRIPVPAGRTFDFAFVDDSLVESTASGLADALGGLAPEVRVALLAPMNFDREGEAQLAGVETCLRQPVRRAELLRFLGGDEIAARPAEAEDVSAEPAPAPRASARDAPLVLVVEDNLTNQTVARAMLESLGVRVELVADGLEAVIATARQRYDLVLMDCQMPEMDGYEASRKIRESERRARSEAVAIVAMTASVMAGDRERCAAAGMDDYLGKPFDYQQLALTLRRHLGPGWQPPLASDATRELERIDWDELEESPADSGSPIDPRPLEIIRSLSADGDPELVRTVIRSFLEEAPQMLAEMRAGLERGDLEAVQRSAHRLKSSSANLGAVHVTRLSRDLETLGRDGVAEGAPELLFELDKAFARARRALEEEWHRAA